MTIESSHGFGTKILQFLLVGGLTVMTGMWLWSYHLANDFTGKYGSAGFHNGFWAVFFAGSVLFLIGSFLYSLLLPRFGVLLGLGTVALSVILIVFVMFVPIVNKEDWTGASALMLIITLFCCGILSTLVGALRLLWERLRA